MPFSHLGVPRECGVSLMRAVYLLPTVFLLLLTVWTPMDWLKEYQAFEFESAESQRPGASWPYPLFFSQPSAIPCNADVPCHFPNTGKLWRAARRWARNNVRPQWSDRPHAVFLSLSALPSIRFFPSLFLPVPLQQPLVFPRIDVSLLGSQIHKNHTHLCATHLFPCSCTHAHACSCKKY